MSHFKNPSEPLLFVNWLASDKLHEHLHSVNKANVVKHKRNLELQLRKLIKLNRRFDYRFECS